MPWKVVKRDCKQADGTSGNYVVVKEKGDGSTEQSSCHDTEEKAQGSIAAREMREGGKLRITKGQLRTIIQEAIDEEELYELSQDVETTAADLYGAIDNALMSLGADQPDLTGKYAKLRAILDETFPDLSGMY